MARNIYEELGLATPINAAGHITFIGGTRMSERTVERMRQAAASYVDIKQLQQVLHGRIAKMTRNEEAFICNGAASGLYLTLAACVSLKMKQPFQAIAPEQIRSKEVIMFAAQRNPYDEVIRQLGLRLVQIGYPNIIEPPTVDDLIQAVTDQTIAVYYVAGNDRGWVAKGALPLTDIIPAAQLKNIPVIVDAAAQLPPKENLWRFTQEGADAAVFSGGKDLAGPQASGLVLGKHALVQQVQEIGYPNYGIGRMMKVGREEMIGLYAALEQYLEMDPADWHARCDQLVDEMVRGLSRSELFRAERSFPNESGQPIPRAFVRILLPERLTPRHLMQLLLQGNPPVYTVDEGEPGIYVNPMTLTDEDWPPILQRLEEIEHVILS